jgi:hypothetical protein
MRLHWLCPRLRASNGWDGWMLRWFAIDVIPERTLSISPSREGKEQTRNTLVVAGSKDGGRSRDRTCDPSRVKRVLYR